MADKPSLLPWHDLLKLPTAITRPIGLITLALILVFGLGFFLRDQAKDSPVVFYGLFLGAVLMLVLAGIAMLNAADRYAQTSANAQKTMFPSEFLLVVFPGQRRVCADGDPVGVTNHMIAIHSNEYTITLDGSPTLPPSQDVILLNTSLERPKVVVFSPA